MRLIGLVPQVALLFAFSASATPWTSKLLAPRQNGRRCEVTALGNSSDDTPAILDAFRSCNNGGTVVFPEGQNYTIGSKLNPVITDVLIEWQGVWTLSNDLDYWRNNSYPVAFQNHHAGVVFTGERITINGHGTGGIFGNGNAWYDAEKAVTQPGRPMPFVFWNASDVKVEHFFVKQPPLWSINIMNGTNMWFDDIYVNATALNAPYGENWVQNTDGFDTMDANNIRLTNMVYQGGDDCIAIKPRSYNIYVQNNAFTYYSDQITCHGGNGPAIGSLGQYLEDSSVINVLVKDVNILTNNVDMHGSGLIKTWVGALVPQNNYESGGLPRGGGWGVVQNIRFENFYVEGAAAGPSINENSGNNGSSAGTSLMEISNIAFVNFTGYLSGTKNNYTASVTCSSVEPCFNIAFQNISLAASENYTATGAIGVCSNTTDGGVFGMEC